MSSPDQWVLRLEVSPERSELAADRLWREGATGIEERSEGAAGTVLEAGFPTDRAARHVAARLAAEGWPAEAIALGPDIWLDQWREHAAPVASGGQLLIAPAWRDTPLGDGRIVIRLDPGRVFGSGSHPATRMLLAALETVTLRDADVLDVGTGSGVLAIAAVLLGGRSAVGVDIDPDSPATAERNAAINGVADRTRFSTTPVEGVDGVFDVVLANLSAATLAGLAGRLTDRLAPRGTLLVSGMLPGQWPHVADAFGGLEVVERLALDGWEGRRLRRRT